MSAAGKACASAEGHDLVTSQDGIPGSLTGDSYPERPGEPPSFDTTVSHPARTYDYWLGGKDNYEADRDVGDQAMATLPTIPLAARANRAFLRRAVEYLAGEVGIRQFLDIGTGLPTAENTHQVAQRVAPESRVVYVDNDPIVLAHARALLAGTPQGATAYIQADARDPETILREAAATLDFSQPVAVMMLAVLHFIPDSDDPAGIVARLMDAVVPGSYLAASVATSDVDTERVIRASSEFNTARVAARLFVHTHAEFTRYFADLDLVEPGLVLVAQWRAPADLANPIPMYSGVGRKP
jgi:O-methyltransferase involved in polyketide biosynthesis